MSIELNTNKSIFFDDPHFIDRLFGSSPTEMFAYSLNEPVLSFDNFESMLNTNDQNTSFNLLDEIDSGCRSIFKLIRNKITQSYTSLFDSSSKEQDDSSKRNSNNFIGNITNSIRNAARTFNERFISPVKGRITSLFGDRIHPILKKGKSHICKFHNGVDIGAPEGTSILASRGGIVIKVDENGKGAGGKTVTLDHGGGYATTYCHASSINVTPGQEVKQGQIIARVGSTGRSTGPHLHFIVKKDGRPQNPLKHVHIA